MTGSPPADTLVDGEAAASDDAAFSAQMRQAESESLLYARAQGIAEEEDHPDAGDTTGETEEPWAGNSFNQIKKTKEKKHTFFNIE